MLLNLALDDDDAVRAFCQRAEWWAYETDHDGVALSYPVSLISGESELSENRERLSLARKIIEQVASTIAVGGYEPWARLEAALSVLGTTKLPRIMMLRAKVVELVAFWGRLYQDPVIRERTRAVTSLRIRLGVVARQFDGLDRAKIVEVLTRKNTPILQAAKLSISVNAFGDGGAKASVVETRFARAWTSSPMSKQDLEPRLRAVGLRVITPPVAKRTNAPTPSKKARRKSPSKKPKRMQDDKPKSRI